MGKATSIAVTGTPGTGKSTACALLKEYQVIDLNELIRKNSKRFQLDEERDSIDVDTSILKGLLPMMTGIRIIEGHLAHLLGPDIAIILRCSPKMLKERLKKKNWSKEKIQENLEAEAVDVILIEAEDTDAEILEIDTTKMSPDEVAEAIREIIAGERRKYRPGNIDWSKEVLDWY